MLYGVNIGLLALFFSGCLLSSNYIGGQEHNLTNYIDNSTDVCGHYDETLFVNYDNDLELLSHCRIINTSIFISGGYHINSLKMLSNLQYIMGYLVIIDSHSLSNLNGLHNLVSIVGQELYSSNYSVAIRHNIELLSVVGAGLCYTELVNWNLVTDFNTWIDDNGNFCPECDVNCKGCWGPGPQLCQMCLNYLSGITCVDECPVGTSVDVDDNDSLIIPGGEWRVDTCVEKIPEPPFLTFYASSYYIDLYVDFKNTTNGILLGYELIKNNEVCLDYKSNRETWPFYNNLFINITDLLPYTIYNFSMRVYNSINYSNYTDVISIMTDVGYSLQPLTPVADIMNDEIVITLNETPGIDLNGPIVKYELVDNFNVIKYFGNFISIFFVKDNINYDVNYSFALRAYTNNVMYSLSNWSNEVMIRRSVSSFNEDSGISTFWLILIICGAVLGLIIKVSIIVKIVSVIRERNKMRRQLRYADAVMEHDINREEGINNINYTNTVFFTKNVLYESADDANMTITNGGLGIDGLGIDGAGGLGIDEDDLCEVNFSGVSERTLKHYYSEISEEDGNTRVVETADGDDTYMTVKT